MDDKGWTGMDKPRRTLGLQGLQLPHSNVSCVQHSDVPRRLAPMHHCSKREMLLVQADLNAWAAALHHEEGAQNSVALNQDLLLEGHDATLWAESHFYDAGAFLGQQGDIAGRSHGENLPGKPEAEPSEP